MKTELTGIPWCRCQHYQKLRFIFEDSATFPETYSEWIGIAEAKIRYFKSRGHKDIVKVPIDPFEFPRWCQAHRKKTDAKGRIAYVAHKLREMNPRG